MTIKVILPVKKIPQNSRITKIKGAKEYILKDSLTIYDEKNEKQVIKCRDGARFLVSEDGGINVVDSRTELVWLAPEYALQQYLEGPQQ